MLNIKFADDWTRTADLSPVSEATALSTEPQPLPSIFLKNKNSERVELPWVV